MTKLTLINTRNTDETTCSCCGRQNLIQTVTFRTEGGALVYYGVGCAKKAITGFNKTLSLYEKIAHKIEVVESYAKTGTLLNGSYALADAIARTFQVAAIVEGNKIVVARVGEFDIPAAIAALD